MATKVESNQLTDYWEDAATQTLPDYSEQTSTGFAQDGNPVTGQKATLPGAAWFNIMAAVRVSVILAAGKTPSNPPDPMQFLEALQSLGWMTSKSVKTDVLADKSVTNAKLADQAVTIAKIANALLATQSQAEAGTSSDVLMTPLRVKQAIEKALEEDLPKASETQLGGVKITGDDGITINEAGEIAVDFSEMPTDKFEDLLKSIRVPIWLTANKQFYVDKTTGSDTLDEGRGESSSKPFKTISACVKYITDNYNMSIYRAYVNVTPNTYTEQLNFGSYSVTTGLVYLRSTDSSQKVIVENPTGVASTVNISNANYTFQYFDFVVNVTTQNVLRSNSVVSCVYVASYSSVLFLDCDFHLNVSNSDKPAAFLGRMIRAGAYGIAEVQNTTNIKATNTSGFSMNAVFTSSGGKFNFLGSTDQTYCYISGDFSTVVYCINGAIQANNNGPISDVIVTTPGGETCTGKRYSAESGGSINTLGGGSEFFPGSIAGTVEASTYSWYR